LFDMYTQTPVTKSITLASQTEIECANKFSITKPMAVTPEVCVVRFGLTATAK